MSIFEELRRKLIYLDLKEVKRIERAYILANKAHKSQKRRTGKPYISHPIAVASIIADLKLDAETIIASLLHDVIEDTPITKKDIGNIFGLSVANLVDGVTKLDQIKFDNRAEAVAENFRKMIIAMARDMRVIIIKLADRLHNMRTLSSLSNKKRHRIAQETLEIFAPVARRLGMREFYIELEDLAFFTLHPWRYKILEKSLEKTRRAREKHLGHINKTLKDGLAQQHISYQRITGREKHLYSIYRKIKVRRIPIDEIMDVYAFRVIVNDVDSCYRALGIVHRLFKPVPGRFKDYIAIPKANGYQSLHTILFGAKGIPVEVQIRTAEMDKTATSGIAAHWFYKNDEKDNPSKGKNIGKEWVNSLLELQGNVDNPLEFIENVKVDLFPDEVYVFTPQGEIMSLPGGATTVDFAYAVHTDIGNTCVAVKIDRQLAPLSSILSNGQTIEIITSKDSRPNPAWLDFVITSKARSNIRHFLRTQRHIQSIKLGKQLFKKALTQYKLSLHKLPKEALNQLLESFKSEHCHSMNDLFAEIGIGHRTAPLVVQQLLLIIKNINSTQYSIATDLSHPLVINGTEGMLVKFAQCCSPIPGDIITGMIDAGRGIVVHRESCPYITPFRKNRDKYIMLSWADEITRKFITNLRIEAINKPGIIAAISSIFTQQNANIENLTTKIRDSKHRLLTLSALIENRNHLAGIIQRLRKINEINRITRIKADEK